jgi:hypothetical protein
MRESVREGKMKLVDIVGKKVVGVKGYPPQKKSEKLIDPAFILFDDGETYLNLEEQDYYSYHDCSSSARIINLYKDKERWERFMTFPDSNTSI